MGTLFLALSVVFNCAANGFFKASADITDLTARKWVFLGLGLFLGLINTIFYIKSLEEIPLGIAFPAWSGACIVLIALISLVVFHQAISVRQWIGLATICVGLLLVWKT
jgi:multidrug transporter EmrE-like cation transporter